MVSDMAGSSGNAGAGTGIPGPLLSFMKELSSPSCRSSGIPEPTAWASDCGCPKCSTGRSWRSMTRTGGSSKARNAGSTCVWRSVSWARSAGSRCPSSSTSASRAPSTSAAGSPARLTPSASAALGDLGRIAPEDVLPWGTPAMRRMLTVFQRRVRGCRHRRRRRARDGGRGQGAGVPAACQLRRNRNFRGVLRRGRESCDGGKVEGRCGARRGTPSNTSWRTLIVWNLTPKRRACSIPSCDRRSCTTSNGRNTTGTPRGRGRWLDEWSRRITQTIGVEGDGVLPRRKIPV